MPWCWLFDRGRRRRVPNGGGLDGEPVAQRMRIWESALLRSRETAVQIRTSDLFAGWNGPPWDSPMFDSGRRRGRLEQGRARSPGGALDRLLARDDEEGPRRWK